MSENGAQVMHIAGTFKLGSTPIKLLQSNKFFDHPHVKYENDKGLKTSRTPISRGIVRIDLPRVSTICMTYVPFTSIQMMV